VAKMEAPKKMVLDEAHTSRYYMVTQRSLVSVRTLKAHCGSKID
jgi:hypothetical protein